MGKPECNVRSESRLFSKRFGFVKTLALFLFTAGIVFARQPAKDNVRDCVAATLRGFGGDCAVADLDADHQPDTALSFDLQGTTNLPGSISVHLSQGQPDQHLIIPGRWRWSIRSFSARDVDGDGDLDIALTGGRNETVGVFLNDGSGQFQFDESDRYRTGASNDFSQIASRNYRPTCPLAGGGTPYSLAPAQGSPVFVRSTAPLGLESRAVPFRYKGSPARIRAP